MPFEAMPCADCNSFSFIMTRSPEQVWNPPQQHVGWVGPKRNPSLPRYKQMYFLTGYYQLDDRHSVNIRYVCRVGYRPPLCVVGDSPPYGMLFMRSVYIWNYSSKIIHSPVFSSFTFSLSSASNPLKGLLPIPPLSTSFSEPLSYQSAT